MAEQILPLKELHPNLPETGKPIIISDKSIEASTSVSQALSKKDITTAQANAQTLTDSILQDLSVSGVNIKPREKQGVKNRINDIFGQIGTNVEHKVFSPETVKDLESYKTILASLEQTYDLSRVSPEMYEAANGMTRNSVLSTLSMYGFSALISPSYALEIARSAGTLIKEKSLWKRGFAAMSIGMNVLPYIYVLGIIPPILSSEKISKKFKQSMMGLRTRINERAANSLYMRDFEFMHDKPAAEIMNIVNKGKEATIDLFATTYEEIIPMIASMGATTASEFMMAPPAGIMSMLRIPMLAQHGEQTMQGMLVARAEEAQKKDLIDSRILSALQSLEVVKTTENMAHAITELKENMARRDEIATTRNVLEAGREKSAERREMVFSWAIPFVNGGWNALMEKIINPKAGMDEMLMRAAPPFGLSASLEGVSSAFAQLIVKNYVNKIQPAIQDIKRMEELLGPYDQVDTPEGPKEKARMAVGGLNTFDISVKNLSFKDILHEVSLDIPQGSFVTIKGPSGIGKTTFFRHLMGLYGAKEGAVQYGGVDLQNIKKFGEESIYSKIAYANQNPQFFENMTLRENLLLWTKKPTTDIEIRQSLHDLRLDGLIDRLDSKVKHYSGGELRRIGIARALLKDPRVLFLDEPTANLDAESATQVLEIIKGLRVKRPEMTVVAVTHDPSFEAIAERIVDFKEINKKPVEQVLVGEAEYNTANQ